MDKKLECPCLSKDFSNSEEDAEFAVFEEETGTLMICQEGKIKIVECEGDQWKKKS